MASLTAVCDGADDWRGLTQPEIWLSQLKRKKFILDRV